MVRLFKKTWFQIMFFGVIIGSLLIFIDSKYELFGPGKEERPEVYNGAITTKTDNMFFTKVAFPETKYDFGKVKEGDTVMHKFLIQNRGSEPLMIFKSKGSCDCIEAYHSEKPILPGNEELIAVY